MTFSKTSRILLTALAVLGLSPLALDALGSSEQDPIKTLEDAKAPMQDDDSAQPPPSQIFTVVESMDSLALRGAPEACDGRVMLQGPVRITSLNSNASPVRLLRGELCARVTFSRGELYLDADSALTIGQSRGIDAAAIVSGVRL